MGKPIMVSNLFLQTKDNNMPSMIKFSIIEKTLIHFIKGIDQPVLHKQDVSPIISDCYMLPDS
jgi:hypothetical protein